MKDLVCPVCHNHLKVEEDTPRIKCENCGIFYTKKRRTWDFRSNLNVKSEDWNSLQFDICYQKIGKFIDGYEHAKRSGIPKFIEDYRLSKVKDCLAQYITSKNHGHLLDLGCGNGWYALRLKEKWGYSGEITGVDVSPFQINVFKNEIEKRKLTNIKVYCANSEVLPFPDSYFDKIVLTEVLEHVMSPTNTIREISRVLKPGGTLYLSTPSGPICKFWKIVVWPVQKIKRIFVPRKTKPEDQIYDVPLSKNSIVKMISQNDLKIITYFKSILLPHESYLQFIPIPLLRIMLKLAKTLEQVNVINMFLGLHYMFIVNKPWHSNPVINKN